MATQSAYGANLDLDLQKRQNKTAKALKALDKAKEPEVRAQLIWHQRVDEARNKSLSQAGQFIRERDQERFIPPGVWATGAPSLWQQGITGRTSLIGIIDSGIDPNHPDLRDKVVIRHNYVNDSEWNPHGTHVAGTVAAKGNIMGVAPDAKLADYRVLDKNGSGSFVDITKAIYQATLDGCNIINLSLGSQVGYEPMHAAIQNAVEHGVLVVAAVGNEGDGNPTTDEISYPGYYSEVCGAGAVQFSTSINEEKTILDAYFTNTNKEVDVAAPGWEIWSTLPNGKYGGMSGTSMASPHVSGFAALLLDKFRTRTQLMPPPGMLFAMVKSMTVDIDELGIDTTTGAGFITFWPEIPKKRDRRWVFDDLDLGMPQIQEIGSVPPVRKSGRVEGFNYTKKRYFPGRQPSGGPI
jgi:major intracellular serine protease